MAGKLEVAFATNEKHVVAEVQSIALAAWRHAEAKTQHSAPTKLKHAVEVL